MKYDHENLFICSFAYHVTRWATTQIDRYFSIRYFFVRCIFDHIKPDIKHIRTHGHLRFFRSRFKVHFIGIFVHILYFEGICDSDGHNTFRILLSLYVCSLLEKSGHGQNDITFIPFFNVHFIHVSVIEMNENCLLFSIWNLMRWK